MCCCGWSSTQPFPILPFRTLQKRWKPQTKRNEKRVSAGKRTHDGGRQERIRQEGTGRTPKRANRRKSVTPHPMRLARPSADSPELIGPVSSLASNASTWLVCWWWAMRRARRRCENGVTGSCCAGTASWRHEPPNTARRFPRQRDVAKGNAPRNLEPEAHQPRPAWICIRSRKKKRAEARKRTKPTKAKKISHTHKPTHSESYAQIILRTRTSTDTHTAGKESATHELNHLDFFITISPAA